MRDEKFSVFPRRQHAGVPDGTIAERRRSRHDLI